MYPFNGPLGSKFDVQPYHTLLPTGPSYIKKKPSAGGCKLTGFLKHLTVPARPNRNCLLKSFVVSHHWYHWICGVDWKQGKITPKKYIRLRIKHQRVNYLYICYRKFMEHSVTSKWNLEMLLFFSLPSLKKSSIGTKQSSIFFLLIIVWCGAPGRWRTPLRWVFRMIVANPRRSWLCNSASQIKHHGSCECGDPGSVSKTQRFGLRTKFEVARF